MIATSHQPTGPSEAMESGKVACKIVENRIAVFPALPNMSADVEAALSIR